MDKLPRITVITPSYNQGDFIEQTIESVLRQDYPDLEYLIFDGGSTDQTLDILKKYGQRLYWVSERDGGQSDAINKGLCMASGEVICFLNSDDLYEPGALLKVGRFFADHPEAAWLAGKCRTVDPHGREIRRAITVYKNFWLATRSYQVLQVLDYVSQPATFWRRCVLEEVGFLDETLRYAMDYDYSLRVGRKFRLYVLPEYLASYRMHASSKAGSSASAQFDVDLQIARKHVSSPVLAALHAFHNWVIVGIYKLLLSKNPSSV